MGENSQHEASFTVKDRLREPSASSRVVGEEATGQRHLQRSDRNLIQLPDAGATCQLVRCAAAHALTGLLPARKWLHDFLERPPCFRFLTSIGCYAVDREFVRSQREAPFDQPPGLRRGEIGRSKISLD